MASIMYYTIMPDGTVKQLNPFTGTEVWAVAGRRGKPITNEAVQTAKPLEKHSPEDYCSFCAPRYYETAPEKSRLIRTNGSWERVDLLAPDRYFDNTAEFRRTGNLFEIVTLEYWRKNYAYKIPASRVKWREDYLAIPAGLKHISDIVQYKPAARKTDEQIEKMPMAESWPSPTLFGGGMNGHRPASLQGRCTLDTISTPREMTKRSTTGISS
jgi:galactose-1-phosphate uridylyltransferase